MRSCVSLLAICALAAAPAGATDVPTLTWHRTDGTDVWAATLPPAPEDSGAPLHAPPWYARLPAIIAEGIEGERIDFSSFAGKVLIVDFWASWCTPCAKQLPEMQAFWDAERENGLEVVTVHADESDDIARRFARERGVTTLPIARYNGDVRESFQIGGLPTVIVADRAGNLRRRFTAGGPGTKEALQGFVRELLDETPEAGPEIARVVRGAELLSVSWSRTVGAAVLGLSVLEDTGPPEKRIFAATGWDVIGFSVKGEERLTRKVGPGVERLRRAGEHDDGPMMLFGFRSASERVVRISLGEADPESWDAPARVLDLAVEPPRFDANRGLLLATIEGLHRVGFDGSPLAARTDLGVITALARADGRTLALGGGKLRRLDHELKTLGEWDVPAGSRTIVAASDLAPGIGLAPAAVLDGAAGRFLEGGGAQLALALEDRLIVVDLETGEERFRARWPRIAALGADDLDGDGRTELIVASAKRITVLSSR